MSYNGFTKEQLEYEFLYNLRDQALLFLKMSDSDNARTKVILQKLEFMVKDLEEGMEK